MSDAHHKRMSGFSNVWFSKKKKKKVVLRKKNIFLCLNQKGIMLKWMLMWESAKDKSYWSGITWINEK